MGSRAGRHARRFVIVLGRRARDGDDGDPAPARVGGNRLALSVRR
jgi:hypothetical protein